MRIRCILMVMCTVNKLNAQDLKGDELGSKWTHLFCQITIILKTKPLIYRFPSLNDIAPQGISVTGLRKCPTDKGLSSFIFLLTEISYGKILLSFSADSNCAAYFLYLTSI